MVMRSTKKGHLIGKVERVFPPGKVEMTSLEKGGSSHQVCRGIFKN